ncbi:MAG: hypothetical protein COT84_02480 [Chlamydiae bacterium CG10_big_fil_rev_8_21_14_0_10_35_9]|nr:MAG: hypothetical protein COT84_02480 [Chlamydiae bacterium CG10_big_fil_rev_8_21_14_0_10_35_9]
MRSYALYFAWLVSLVGSLTSLYYSEILLITPCSLCWYQRICMYPLIFILPIAIIKQDSSVKIYILPQMIIGAFLSLWHYLIQNIPMFALPALCGLQSSCADARYKIFGVSFPLVSLIGFSIMILLTSIARFNHSTGQG